MPRSPRYSCAHLSNAKTCASRSLGPSAWHACMYSCAIVPSGVTPCFIASSTFDVPATPLRQVGIRLRAAEVHLGHDRQHWDLVQDRVQPRAPDRDVDALVRPALDMDVLLVELEQREEVHEVRLHEAQSAQVRELRLLEPQPAQ